jgi:hypothetical protein
MRSVREAPVLTPIGVGAALLGAAAGAGLWVGMTATFHLIFHLQPALIGAGAGWAVRRSDGLGWTPGRGIAVLIASGAALAGGLAAIHAAHGPTDPLPLTLVIAVAGAGIGQILLAGRLPGGLHHHGEDERAR